MHVGKAYPITMINTVWLIEVPTRQPVRKLMLQSNALGTSGTVANSWAGLDVLSDVAYRHPTNSTWTSWDFQHPTDPLATITFSAWLKEITPTPGGGVCYEWDSIWEPYYNGVKLADKRAVEDMSGAFQTHIPEFLAGPGWDNKTDVPKWNQFRCWNRAATWAEQPEYHPYRH